MPNKRTKALTQEEYYLVVDTIRRGFTTATGLHYPNPRIATILVLQANLGLRISDVINLRLSDILRDGGRYRLNIVEQKTGKAREFTVPQEVYSYIQGYALDNDIKPTQKLFDIGIRAVQKHIKVVADHLGLENIGTHSFRKFFAVSIYNNNGYNVELVRQLLQHSTVAVTQHYLSVQPQLIEQALQNHIKLPTG